MWDVDGVENDENRLESPEAVDTVDTGRDNP
jgi:hypothetical protein